MSDTKASLIAFFIVTGTLGLILGGCSSLARGKCTYDNLLSYFPTYVIGCELGKKRF